MAEEKARKPKALIDAEKKIIELEKSLDYEKRTKESYLKQYQESEAIVSGIHDILDDLGIRAFKDENKYTRIPLAVRLFAWAMKLTNAKAVQ